MSSSISVEFQVHFRRRGRNRALDLREGAAAALPNVAVGRVPRIARLMALAIRYEELIRSEQVADFAELARLGHVTRARVTQIMNLRLLAPDIQEALLELPRISKGRDQLTLPHLQPITLLLDWRMQRKQWEGLRKKLRIDDTGSALTQASSPPIPAANS